MRQRPRLGPLQGGGALHDKTISLRRVAARSRGAQGTPPFCTFKSTVSFNDVSRLLPSGQLKIGVRFLNNDNYKPRQGATRFVRAMIARRR